MPSSSDTAQFLARMRARIDTTLSPLLHGVRRVALVDFPDYGNVGDSLIWLGELEALRRLGIGSPAYVTNREAYDRASLARAIGDGVILIHGGGNLGDLWPSHQDFRERVIADFPANPIIQMPQSVEFRDASALDRARRVFDGHRHLTLLVRTHRSMAICQEHFSTRTALCPDMALGLDRLRRVAPVHDGAVLLARQDHESRLPAALAAPPWMERRDWAREDVRGLVRVMRGMQRRPRLWQRTLAVHASLYRAVTLQRIRAGSALLSRGRVVITDRLHGHVLASLLGIPHCVLDNSYGKVRALWETWTHEVPTAAWSDSWDEALRQAAALRQDVLTQEGITAPRPPRSSRTSGSPPSGDGPRPAGASAAPGPPPA